jgi:hypothetical protein
MDRLHSASRFSRYRFADGSRLIYQDMLRNAKERRVAVLSKYPYAKRRMSIGTDKPVNDGEGRGKLVANE